MRIIKHRRNNPYKLNRGDLVEIDVSKHLDSVYVVNHPNDDNCICTLDDYLIIAERKKIRLIAVDMKSKGLEEKIIKGLDKHDIPGFVFDLKNYQIDLKYGYSDRVPIMLNEDNPFLQSFEPKEWIWLHTLDKDIDFLMGQYKNIRKKSPYVGICFSGIHEFKKKKLKNLLYNTRKDGNVYLCTDEYYELLEGF